MDTPFGPSSHLQSEPSTRPFHGSTSDRRKSLAGFLWNLVAVGIAALYLERLTKQLLGPAIASSTLLLLAVYPSTFFFTVIYSEATCILFIAASQIGRASCRERV